MRDAMIVFKRFQGAGLRPDVVSYTTLIQGFGKLKSYKKVTDVFTQMQRNRYYFNASSSGNIHLRFLSF